MFMNIPPLILIFCIAPLLAILVIALVIYFGAKLNNFQPWDYYDFTDWRPSGNYPKSYWRFNHFTNQFQYCNHPHLDDYYETKEFIVKRCPECGFTETTYKK